VAFRFLSADTHPDHDTLGNFRKTFLVELEDCWHDNYEDAPAGGTAWKEQNNGACPRVLRGGAWISTRNYLRSAHRYRGSPVNRYDNIGFRLAQD
jgi:formylglycine-generating enzyme required for sulfatase activity